MAVIAHGRGVDKCGDALVGIDEDVAEGGEDSIEVREEGERWREEVGIGSFVGGEGGVREV